MIHSLRPTHRLLAGVLASTLLAITPARVDAKGCAEGSPAAAPPSTLWSELQPVALPGVQTVNAFPIDSTQFTGSQLPTPSYPITTSVDIEGGYLLQTFFGGWAMWDLSAGAEHPNRTFLASWFNQQFPHWEPSGEFTQVIFGVDSPEGAGGNLIAVGGMPIHGVSIWDATSKTNVRGIYQDYHSKGVYQVYTAVINGTSYAFAGTFLGDPGVHIYNMSLAKQLFANNPCTEDRSSGVGNCNGVYVTKMDGGSPDKYVSGLGVGSRHFVTTSTGNTFSGVKIWDVSNPSVPVLVVSDLAGSASHAVLGTAMWTHGGQHYLAMRDANVARIYNVTSCLTSGCSSLGSPVWQSGALFSYTDSPEWVSMTFSRGGPSNTPFLYMGNSDPCRTSQPLFRTEYLFDVSTPASPRDIVDPNKKILAPGEGGVEVMVDYWSWYYSTNLRGYSFMMPRMGKFNGDYFYRAAGSLFDAHKWVNATPLPPVANFTWSPTTIYPGDTVTFTDTSSGAPTQWSWSFQDGSPSSATTANPSTAFLSPGNKSVSLTATNGQGPGSLSQTVSVTDPMPAVRAAVATPSTALVCQPITLTGDGVTGKAPLSYQWQVKNVDQVVVASGSTASMVWNPGNAPGGYTATLTVSNTSGSANATTGITLSALGPLPAADSFAPTNDAFAAGTVQFHANVANATEWKWDFGDGTVTGWLSDPTTGPNPTHAYTETGSKTVRVWVRNCAEGQPNGVQSAALTINITQISQLEILNFRAACGIFCDFPVNTPVTFTVEVDGNPTSYEYDWNGDGTFEQISSTVVTSHTYTAVGQITPRFRARRGAEVKETTHFALINIYNSTPPPPPPPTSPTLSISGASSGQPGQALSFSAAASNCTPSSTYTWTATGDGVITGTGSSVQITWPAVGSKTVTVKNASCTGAQGTKSVNIQTTTPPTGGFAAAYTFSPANPAVGQAVSFDASSSTGNPTVWFWEFGDNTTSEVQKPTHTFTQAGTYTVRLTIAKDCGSGNCTTNVTSKTVVVGGTPPGPTVVAGFTTNAACSSDLTGIRCNANVGDTYTFNSTSTGSPTSETWSFGDGQTATGANVTHKWTTNGTFTVLLTATNGTSTSTAGLLFLVEGTVAPVLPAAVIVPWIAQSDIGAVVQSSDLYLFNPGSAPSEVTITYRKRGTPDANPPKVTRTLAAGQTTFLADILGLFERRNESGFIYIQPKEGSATPAVVSFNRAFDNGQAFGQSVPGIPLEGLSPAAGGPTSQQLIGMNDNGERTAYFGISNPTGATASYHLRFYDRDGHLLATTETGAAQVVGDYGQKQFQTSVIRELGVTNQTDYRIEVVTVAGGPVFPFGATRRTGSDDPSYIPAIGSGRSTQYLLGMITGAGAAGSLWASDALLVNPASLPMAVTLRFLPVGVASVASAPLTLALAGGESRRLSDILDNQWHVANGAGTLVIESAGAEGKFPLALGETYTTNNPLKAFGQTVMAQDERAAATTGKSQALVGLRQDSSYRTVVWLFSPGTEGANLEVTYRGLDGAQLAKFDYGVPGGKARQIVGAQHNLPTGFAGAFSVEIKVKSGKVLAAAQVVNNATNDPAYVVGLTR